MIMLHPLWIFSLVATARAAEWRGRLHDRDHYLAAFAEWTSRWAPSEALHGGAPESEQRLESFATNLDQVETSNAAGGPYTLATNRYSAMPYQEWASKVLRPMAAQPTVPRRSAAVFSAPSDMATLPDSVDWAAAGATTPVLDQGVCASCWTFAATGALEGAMFIKCVGHRRSLPRL